MKQGWEVRLLSDLCIIKPPKKEAREKLHPDDLVSFAPMNDLGEVEKTFSASEQRPLSKVIGGYTYFADGDVLVAKITPCFENGKMGIARNLTNGVGFGSSEYVVLRSKGELDPEYLFYFLSRYEFREAGARIMSGAVGHKRVPKEYFEDLPVPFPSLAEQKRIVAVLDKAFEGLARARANTEANLQNAQELLVAFREQEISSQKVGWNESPLGALVTIKHGYAFKSEFFTDRGNFVLLTPGNFFETGGYRYRGEKQKFYTGEIPDGFVLAKDDMLVAMTEQAPGLLGSCLIVPEGDCYLHNQRLGLITPIDQDTWHSEYFAEAFNLRAFRKALSDTCTGIKVRHTSPRKIYDTALPIPSSKSEQIQVADRVRLLKTHLDKMQVGFSNKVSDIDQLKQSLLKKAFAGELT